MKDIKIKSAKLIKGGEKLEVVYKETGENKSTVDKTCEEPVHPDLRRATGALAPHLALLTEYITEKQISDAEELERFVVTGYSIGGKEDQEGVTITGYRKTKRGGTVTLNSPFTRLEENPETRYVLMDDLLNKINLAETEVLSYLFEGKKGEDPQGKLFDDDEDVTHMQITEGKTEEDENEEMLGNLKSSKGHISQANPEAMDSIKNWDNPNNVIDNTVNDMVQDQREHLRGKRNGQGKGKGKASAKA